MKTIFLSGRIGGVAIVDDTDFDLISRYRWWADVKPTKNTFLVYAYTQIVINGKRRTVRMHQLITGSNHTDHKDGNGLNNQRSNLRQATRCQQAWNTHYRRGSLPKGVTHLKRLKKNPYQARIAVNGKQRHLGYFATPEKAAEIYAANAKELFGEFACPY